ncbi:unnamed protein product [Eretmochelys imbricata]
MSLVILRTSHTPVRYVFSGWVNEGRVSSLRLANWTLNLLNRDITVQRSPQLSILPYALLTKGQEHDCPLPAPDPVIVSPFWFSKAKEQGLTIWAADGSSYYQGGHPRTGYTAFQPSSQQVLQGTIKPHSAQAAEVVAIVAGLYEEDRSKHLCTCSNSEWVVRAFTSWMPIWMQRSMGSADGKPIKYAAYLRHAWELATNCTGETVLCKVKAHRKDSAKASRLNHWADTLAKEAALLGGRASVDPNTVLACDENTAARN